MWQILCPWSSSAVILGQSIFLAIMFKTLKVVRLHITHFLDNNLTNIVLELAKKEEIFL